MLRPLKAGLIALQYRHGDLLRPAKSARYAMTGFPAAPRSDPDHGADRAAVPRPWRVAAPAAAVEARADRGARDGLARCPGAAAANPRRSKAARISPGRGRGRLPQRPRAVPARDCPERARGVSDPHAAGGRRGPGAILVDRGFVPTELRDPAKRAAGQPSGTVRVVGLLRLPPAGRPNWFLPDNRSDLNHWFWVDLPAMAAADHLDGLAPYYIAADKSPNPGGWPQGGSDLLPELPNNHLQYAITWLALAVAMGVIYVIYHRHRMLGRRARGVEPAFHTGAECQTRGLQRRRERPISRPRAAPRLPAKTNSGPEAFTKGYRPRGTHCSILLPSPVPAIETD